MAFCQDYNRQQEDQEEETPLDLMSTEHNGNRYLICRYGVTVSSYSFQVLTYDGLNHCRHIGLTIPVALRLMADHITDQCGPVGEVKEYI